MSHNANSLVSERKQKVLLVEDDPNLGLLLQDYLQLKGKYDVSLAKDGEEGFNFFKNDRFDICILDVMMPKKDGFDVLQALAANSETSVIPVLVFSTLGQEKDIQKAIDLGAKGYTNKSFYDIDQLLKKIFEVAGK